MIPAERQRTILSLLSHQEVLSISDLTDHLGVSHMTIRRDIVKLESSGKVVSVSGGVQLAQALHSYCVLSASASNQKSQQFISAGKVFGLLGFFDFISCYSSLSRCPDWFSKEENTAPCALCSRNWRLTLLTD